MLRRRINTPGVGNAVDRAVWEFEPAGSNQSVLGDNRWPAELRLKNRPKIEAPPEDSTL